MPTFCLSCSSIPSGKQCDGAIPGTGSSPSVLVMGTSGGSTMAWGCRCLGVAGAWVFECPAAHLGRSSLTGLRLMTLLVWHGFQVRGIDASPHSRNMISLHALSAFPTTRPDLPDHRALSFPAPPCSQYRFWSAFIVPPTQIRPKECWVRTLTQ